MNSWQNIKLAATTTIADTSLVELDPCSLISRVSKLEPKLVSALSETRRLFRLFCFNIKTGSFGVSKQPKQTKDQPKQQEIC